MKNSRSIEAKIVLAILITIPFGLADVTRPAKTVNQKVVSQYNTADASVDRQLVSYKRVCKGDVNLDSAVNLGDIGPFLEMYEEYGKLDNSHDIWANSYDKWAFWAADMNNNNSLERKDKALFIKVLAGKIKPRCMKVKL